MVKKTVMTLLCAALGSSLNAGTIAESKKFVGLETGLAEVQGDSARGDEKGVEFGLRVGAQIDQWRAMVLLNYFDKDDQNVEKMMLAVDYYFLDPEEGALSLKPYLGVNVGYMNYEVSYQEDANGFLYGVQAGVALEVTESIDLDLGYRYSLSNTDEFDHMGSVVLGLNYLY